jgi:sucrose phosphorylase
MASLKETALLDYAIDCSLIAMRNQVQLITYVDRFGGHTLKDLNRLITVRLKGVFGGIHILPFFLPIAGADAGFDPIDHTMVDPSIGDWNDIKAIADNVDLVADVIVNHISVDSPQFQDYRQHGTASAYSKLFLTVDDVFPSGATPSDLAAIYRPRPGLPFTKIMLQSGEERMFWTTFTPQQIDINVERSEGLAYLENFLCRVLEAGVRIIRLDAVGYAVKRAGTSCFMLPETYDFIVKLTQRARNLGMDVLVETHSYYRDQIEIARHVDWVYDFALPPLILHAFAFKTAKHLNEWLQIRPNNALTVLDTHDGIGINDIGADSRDSAGRPGLVPPEELSELINIIHRSTNGDSVRATGAAASNLDIYQVNSTFFDAMGRDETRYLLARAVQFFLPGIPQVYYVGLLAGGNDTALLERTGVGRDINRHYYSDKDVEHELERPVVKQLLELIRIRNNHGAFGGHFEARLGTAGSLLLQWSKAEMWARLTVDFVSGEGELQYTDGPQIQKICFAAHPLDPTCEHATHPEGPSDRAVI